MLRPTHRLFAAAVLGVAALVASPLGGCKSMNDMLNASAMDLLSQAVKDAANSYISNLNNLIKMLGNVTTLQGAMDLANHAEDSVKQIESAYRTLSATTGPERTNLIKAFGPKLDNVNSGFLSQADKLKGSGMLSQFVTPVLDKVKLFQK